MSKPKSQARKPLEVSITFESSRLSALHLADAYGQVVALRRRSTPATSPSPQYTTATQNRASTRGGKS